MTTLSYGVPGVSCAHCRRAIEDEVSQVQGVESVEVDLDTKTVRVSGDPLEEVSIAAAIYEAGYEVAT